MDNKEQLRTFQKTRPGLNRFQECGCAQHPRDVLNTRESTIQYAQKVARASDRLAQGMIGSERLRYPN